jgi:hypothetical protein
VGVERFSTDDIPERDRLAVINEVVARHIAGRHLRPVAGTDLRVEIVAFSLPDQLTVGAGSYSPIIGSRSVDMLDDGRDDYLLTLHTHDHEVSVDGGRLVRVAAGEMMLISEAVHDTHRCQSRCHEPARPLKLFLQSFRFTRSWFARRRDGAVTPL